MMPVPQPRSDKQFLTAEFLATKKRLEELVHPEDPSDQDNQAKLNMVRMVGVDDEVPSVF